MSESLQLRGTLRGHNGWVTQVATNPKYPDMLLSASRGRFPSTCVDCNILSNYYNIAVQNRNSLRNRL